jgi:hypothetical protein
MLGGLRRTEGGVTRSCAGIGGCDRCAGKPRAQALDLRARWRHVAACRVEDGARVGVISSTFAPPGWGTGSAMCSMGLFAVPATY